MYVLVVNNLRAGEALVDGLRFVRAVRLCGKVASAIISWGFEGLGSDPFLVVP